MLKTQIMTMTMMKRGQGQGGQGDSDIMMILYSMIMISFIEWIFRNIPIAAASATEFIKPHLNTWIADRQKALVPKMLMDQSQGPQKPLNSITLIRNYGSDSKGKGSDETNPLIEKVDAVLDHICTLDEARHIRVDTRVTLNTERPIALSTKSDLTAKIQQITSTNENRTEILLTSRDLSVSAIRAWIDEIHEAFVVEKNNKLGNKLFYFDEIGGAPPLQMDMSISGGHKQSYKWESMPRALTFSMTEFKTNKSFSNVYGHHVDELKERLDLFLHNPEWYKARGLPHTLSCLLSGVTGAGKSSTFKALINDTKRHPFVVRLRPYTTQQQLKNLFFNETVVVQGPDGQKQTLKIPLHKRFILFEDIDCSSDVVLDREMFPLRPAPEGDAVTLDFLLNLLDGILERPNCLVGASANIVERLDRALIRPGRFDVRIHFGYVDLPYLKDMFGRFYEMSESALDTLDFTDGMAGVFTPAEVIECMCNYYKKPEAALKQLKDKMLDKQRIAMASDPLDRLAPCDVAVVPGDSGGVAGVPSDLPDVAGVPDVAEAPRDLPGVAGVPRDSGGVAEIPRVAGVPGDSGGVAGTPRVAGAPGDSGGVAGTPRDSGGVAGAPGDSGGVAGAPHDLPDVAGVPRDSGDVAGVADVAEVPRGRTFEETRKEADERTRQMLRSIGSPAAEGKFIEWGKIFTVPEKFIYNGVEWECGIRHKFLLRLGFEHCSICNPKIAQLDKQFNTVLSDDHYPQFNGGQKLIKMQQEAEQIKAHLAGVAGVPRDSGGVTKTSGFISPEHRAQESEQRAQYAKYLNKFQQDRTQPEPQILTPTFPSMFAGGDDDLWSNPMFEDAKPPPGAPPFDISMFAGSVRAPTNLNPI